MKQILFTIAFSTLYTIAYTQSQIDYENVMNKFKYFYNSNQLDSLLYLYSNEGHWNLEDIEGLKQKYGSIQSVKYLTLDTVSISKKDIDSINKRYGLKPGDPDALSEKDRGALFKVICSKKTIAVDFNLNEKNKIIGMGFGTSSPYIDSLLLGN
ncbi:MAG: hypothetical protein IPI46_12595 [Bacteroidetes bacterium]|nr:hypothetical protein [Bacteroidota bacterium]